MKNRHKFIAWTGGVKVWANRRTGSIMPTHWKLQSLALSVLRRGR